MYPIVVFALYAGARMPNPKHQNTRVRRCVQHVMDNGYDKGASIAICQSSTRQGYATGRDLDGMPKKTPAKKSDFTKVFKTNPYHEPAGSSKGGRFARKPGGASVADLEAKLSALGVRVFNSREAAKTYQAEVHNLVGSQGSTGMEYIESDKEWGDILNAATTELTRLRDDYGLDLATSGFTMIRVHSTIGTGGMYDRLQNVIVMSGGSPQKEAKEGSESFYQVLGSHWSISAGEALANGDDAGYRATFRHEMGHRLSLADDTIYEYVSREMGKPKNEKYDPEWFARNVSVYGASSVEEMMAETFSNVTSPYYKRGTMPPVFEGMVDLMLGRNVMKQDLGAVLKAGMFADLKSPGPGARLAIPKTWISRQGRFEQEPEIEWDYGHVLKFNPNHDKLGRFASAPGNHGIDSPLDRRLVDYKPDRSLTNPDELDQITEVVPGAEYSAYSQVPFIDRMHSLMGVKDPMTVPVEDYMQARKELFGKQSVVDMSLDRMVVTQRVVNRNRIAQGLAHPEREVDAPIMAVRYQGKNYIMNGHHRVVTYAKNGKATIRARLLNLDAVQKYEVVLKFNPHHDPKTGRFTSGPAGGSGQGSPSRFFPLQAFTSLPDVAVQKFSDKDVLYSKAEVALAHFREWLDKGKGVASKLGYQTMTKAPDAMTVEDWEQPGGMLFIAPLKGKDRAEEKVKTEYGGHWERLLDVVRGTIAVDTIDEVSGLVDRLYDEGMTLARKPKDRLLAPNHDGYRDILLNVRLPGGVIGELQINLKPILKAKVKGHKEYEIMREIDGKYQKQGIKDMELWSEGDRAVYKAAQSRSIEIYNEGWAEAAQGGKP